MEREKENSIDDNAIERAFLLAGENMDRDISAVRISAALDVHYGDVELQLEVFGMGDPDEEFPVFSEALSPEHTAHILGVLAESGAVGAAAVLDIFPPQLRRLLAEKKILVGWNTGWETEKTIDPQAPNQGDFLEVEPR